MEMFKSFFICNFEELTRFIFIRNEAANKVTLLLILQILPLTRKSEIVKVTLLNGKNERIETFSFN
jgi:hypothetical protein